MTCGEQSRLGAILIDFCIPVTLKRRTAFLGASFYARSVENERWVVIRSRRVINMHRFGGRGAAETKVLIVLRLHESATEVLVGFDVDCSLCANDGRNIWLAPRCISALESGTPTF